MHVRVCVPMRIGSCTQPSAMAFAPLGEPDTFVESIRGRGLLKDIEVWGFSV